MLGEGPIHDINGNFGSLEKTFSINFSKSQKIFIWACITMVINSYFFVNGTEIFNFKAVNRSINFLTQLCLESIPGGFDSNDIKSSLKEHGYDFSVDYSATDKFETLSIHKYSIVKNNIK